MLRLKDGFGFSKPIDQLWSVEQLPGYFQLINSPMDLDTVRKRLESAFYMSTPGKAEVEEVVFDAPAFAIDMRLIFNNARTYNRTGDVFYEASTRLLDKFELKFKAMPSLAQLIAQSTKKSKKRRHAPSAHEGKKGESSKRRKAADPDSTPKRRPSAAKKKAAAGASKAKAPASTAGRKKTGAKSTVAPVKDIDAMSAEELESRLRALERRRNLTMPGSPSPTAGQPAYLLEAQALYHVQVTYEEKLELIKNVNELPAEKLRKVISMAKQTSTLEVNMEEEIEFDIEAMDNNTLRDIQALVNQTLYRNKKGVDIGPNGDVQSMAYGEVMSQMGKVRAALKKLGKGMGMDGKGKEKSFYDSRDSSSESESEEESGSESDSSSGESDDSSGEESQSELLRKNRERNLAHQEAMRAAGTPLPSPSYQNQNNGSS